MTESKTKKAPAKLKEEIKLPTEVSEVEDTTLVTHADNYSHELSDKLRRALEECNKALNIDLRLKTAAGYHDFAVRVKSILEEEEDHE